MIRVVKLERASGEMDRNSLTAPEMPCAEERKAALKCSEQFKEKDKKKENCDNFFDQYKECKKNYVESRNAKNRPKEPDQKTPW